MRCRAACILDLNASDVIDTLKEEVMGSLACCKCAPVQKPLVIKFRSS